MYWLDWKIFSQSIWVSVADCWFCLHYFESWDHIFAVLSWNMPIVWISDFLLGLKRFSLEMGYGYSVFGWLLIIIFVVSWDRSYLYWKVKFECTTCMELSFLSHESLKLCLAWYEEFGLEMGCGKSASDWWFVLWGSPYVGKND